MGEYDEATAFLGQTGLYFWMMFFLVNSTFLAPGLSCFVIVFVAAIPKHHCFIPEANLSAAWRKVIIPIEVVNGQEEQSRCQRYRLDEVRNLSALGYIPGQDVNLTELRQESCVDGWSYSQDVFQSTIVTEWDLVCDNQWMIPVASSALFVGYLLGSFISGQLSDRFGRKKIVFFSLGTHCLFGLLLAFSNSWVMFCVVNLLVGASQISVCISAYVLGTEVLSNSMRVLFASLGSFLFCSIGAIVMPAIAFGMRAWRTLLIILSSLSVAYIPLWWLLPESPRWLFTQGRTREADAILRYAARKNKVEAPLVIFKEVENEVSLTPKQYTILHILKSRNISCITLLSMFLWVAINIGYYGLSLNTSNLSGDPFLNGFLSVAIEVPAYISTTWFLKKYPRRILLSSFLITGGVFLLLIQFVPKDHRDIAVAMEMIGKLGFTMAFAILYIYSAELYPTVIRNMGIGICATAARIGSITAPYVLYLGTYSKYLPYILMGSITIGSSVVNIFLPETRNKDLPETLEQMQKCQGLCRREKRNKHLGKEEIADLTIPCEVTF